MNKKILLSYLQGSRDSKEINCW